MVCFTTQRDRFVSQWHRVTRRPVKLSCDFTAAAMMIVAGRARGALIQPISAGDVPVLNTASVFDVGHAGNVYNLEPGTSVAPGGFDFRDLFGGSFGTNGYEEHDVIFDNGQPAGTVDAVDVTLAAPVSLASFNLFLEDDGTNGNRSASEFKLFAGGQLIDDVPILNTFGDESYTGVYGSNYINISDTLTRLPATSDYTLEFIQNQSPGGTSGVRALEFEGTGGAGSVPEPASMAGMIVGGIALCARRRRT
jgi:hypothetical protein